MKNFFLIAFLLALIPRQASAQSRGRDCSDCEIIGRDNCSRYNYCLALTEKKGTQAERLTVFRSWVDPRINPICTIEIIDEQRAIYSTYVSSDTVGMRTDVDINGKRVIEIMFCRSAQKEDLKLILSRRRR